MSITDILFDKVKSGSDGLFSLSVYENGEIWTLEKPMAHRCNNTFSVSKVFTLTAVGMLCDEGKLSIDDHVTDILEEDVPDIVDPAWSRVTLDHVLSHRI